MSDDHSQPSARTFQILGLIIVPLSLLGCLWTCYFCLKKRIMNAFLKYILGLTIANLFYTIANIMSLFKGQGTQEVDYKCITQSIIRESSWLMSSLFACCIAILCFKSSAGETSSFYRRLFFRASLAIGFLICAFLGAGPLLFSDKFRYQNGTFSCVITYKEGATLEEKRLYELTYVVIPNGIALIIVVFSYLGTLCRKKKNGDLIAGTGVSINKLFLFPALMMVEFLPYLVGKYIDEKGKMMTAVVIINFVLTRSIGFLNAIIYGTQMKTFTKKLQHMQDSMTNFSSFISEDRGDFDDEELVMYHRVTRTSF